LINDRLRERLGLPPDPTGEPVMLGSRRFRVIGLLETRNESSMFNFGAFGMAAFIRLTSARESRERGGIDLLRACTSPDLA